MKTTYEPIGNNILVEAILPSTTIAIPGGYDLSEGGRYKVVALGDGDKIPFSIGVGEIVILAPVMAAVKIKDTNLSIVPSDSVLAVVSEEDDANE